jgi:lipopolysaccharide/colanic/teichoic acid biosynthesis glycosyltransferase
MESNESMTSKPDIQDGMGYTGTLGQEKILRCSVAHTGGSKVHWRFTYKSWKPVLDVVFAFVVLVVISPLLLLIAIIIKLDSPGRVLYRREQVGQNGRKFIAYKFRSMYENNNDGEYKKYLVKYILENSPYKVEEDGREIYKVVNDPRVTRFGALLRKNNLEELPQFFNVLKGEMSVIGPRPDIPFAVNMYQDWHRQRLLVKPGISGLWQVSGRKCLSFEDMVRMDIEYINKQSLFLDIKISLLTIATVLSGDGS